MSQNDKPTDKIINEQIHVLSGKVHGLRWKSNFKTQREKMFKIQSILIKQKNKKIKLKEMVNKNTEILSNFTTKIQQIRKGIEFYKTKIENHIF
jgi:hypothetical protein